MDIKDIKPGTPAPVESARDTRAVPPPVPHGSADQPVDRVTMSQEAQVFQQARLAALAVPEVRTDRVEALRRQFAAGQLHADPDRIAKALLTQGVLG